MAARPGIPEASECATVYHEVVNVSQREELLSPAALERPETCADAASRQPADGTFTKTGSLNLGFVRTTLCAGTTRCLRLRLPPDGPMPPGLRGWERRKGGLQRGGCTRLDMGLSWLLQSPGSSSCTELTAYNGSCDALQAHGIGSTSSQASSVEHTTLAARAATRSLSCRITSLSLNDQGQRRVATCGRNAGRGKQER